MVWTSGCAEPEAARQDGEHSGCAEPEAARQMHGNGQEPPERGEKSCRYRMYGKKMLTGMTVYIYKEG